MMYTGNEQKNVAAQNYSAWDTLAFVAAMEFDRTTWLPRVSHIRLLSPPTVQATQANVVPVSNIFHESLEMSIGKSYEPSPFPPHQRQPELVGSKACVSFGPGLLAVAIEVIDVLLNKNHVNRASQSSQEIVSAVISNNSGTSDLHESTDDPEDTGQPSVSRHELHWGFRFERLLAFKERTGHCLVPSDYQFDMELSRWVKRQRHQYKKLQEGKRSTLTQYRLEKLQNVGFVWDVHELSWNENLKELRGFYERHGHSNVPTSYPDNPKLPIWVKSQRREYKHFHMGQKSQLTPARIAALDALEFRWGRFHPSTSNLET
eukprot:scaffold4547_cov103-Cylindrotheca_fusiformis.AAC.7